MVGRIVCGGRERSGSRFSPRNGGDVEAEYGELFSGGPGHVFVDGLPPTPLPALRHESGGRRTLLLAGRVLCWNRWLNRSYLQP